jgi:hypothetical protein
LIYHIGEKEREMQRFNKIPYLVVLVLASLACGLITNPINDAQNLAATAQSIATSMPIQTLEALPSVMPEVTQYLNPTGTPVTTWNNIPIMSQAIAGQEFNKNTYSFKASGVTATDVQTFYTDQMKTLGWSSSFSAQGGSQSGTMLFTKDSNVLSIVVTTSDKDVVVLLLFQ